jgi:hypothetical protein
MKLTQIDLKNRAAVGHQKGALGLLIDRDDEIESVEVTAPAAADDGLPRGADLAGDRPLQLPGREATIAAFHEAELMT